MVSHLQKYHGRKLTTLRRLAKELKMPYSSLKAALNELEKAGTLYRDSVRRGRKSFTILILQSASTSAFVMGHTGIHYGEQEQVVFLEQDELTFPEQEPEPAWANSS